MTHYRLTRPHVYGPKTPGYVHLSARQGYYRDAENAVAAVDIVGKEHPDTSHFDVQDWDNKCYVGRLQNPHYQKPECP